jgi:hypothetical protein
MQAKRQGSALDELTENALAAMKAAKTEEDSGGLAICIEHAVAPVTDGTNDASDWDATGNAPWTTWTTWVTWVTWATR